MKNKKMNLSIIISSVSTMAFILFTFLVKFVDTAYVGFTGKKIGLSSLNKVFFDAVEVNDVFDKLSDMVMVVSVLLILLAVITAIVELIKRKSLKKIDKEIYSFVIVLAIMSVVYILFELIDLNFRPILIDGEIEASYPSSHIMIELTVFMCALIYILNNVKSRNLKIFISSIISVFMIMAVVFRILSGMHWVTDIIASIILSATFASYYVLINKFFKCKNKNEK